MNQPLTPVQARILDFLDTYIRYNGWAPSVKEICEEMRFASTSSAAHQLKNLERKGYIKRHPRFQRAITILGTEEAE